MGQWLIKDLPILAHQICISDDPGMEAISQMEHQRTVAQDAVLVIIAPFGFRDLVSSGDGSERLGEVKLWLRFMKYIHALNYSIVGKICQK